MGILNYRKSLSVKTSWLHLSSKGTVVVPEKWTKQTCGLLQDVLTDRLEGVFSIKLEWREVPTLIANILR